MDNIEFVQYLEESNKWKLQNPKIDGDALMLLKKHMLEDSSTTEKTVNKIFSNSFKILNYLVNPEIEENALNKILCLGKVQSGKTAFFIGTIALAFDNGYNLAYVIGGTKTKLKDQNYNRLKIEFENNPIVKVVDIAQKNHEDPVVLLKMGYKVIIVALKNVGSDSANLGIVTDYSMLLRNVPSLIIDDEGDECSPGAPKLKKKNIRAGKTHDVISEILNNIKVSTFLSVTATPQANLLLSTIDELSPDFAILVEPGDGYIGGNAFHDIYDNPHVIEIKDSDTFDFSTPESFKDALSFFLFSLLVQNYRKNNKNYSMLIHPSSLTKVQSMVLEKVEDYFYYLESVLRNENDIAFDDVLEQIYITGKDCVSDFESYNDFKQKTESYLSYILDQISIYQFNVSEKGKQSILDEQYDPSKYKIFVGGNMLGRGLTIKNLNVTYMYRDSKVTQIDTLYQRARWFGYKSDYFDLCRVYMTKELKYKFIDTVENENDMWNSLNAFLLTKTNIKKFPRIFTLNNEKLRLTRNTVSKTLTVERVNPGYDYDKSISLSTIDLINNRKLYNDLLLKNLKNGDVVQFGNSNIQRHLIVKMKYTEFFEVFLKNYSFPRGSKFGLRSFERLLEQVQNGSYEDLIHVIFMRYEHGEYRTPIANNNAVKELPQSYDNGTRYPGDKKLTGYDDKLHIQLHAVYIDKNKKEDIYPIIALNNPITAFNVRYVTGDNDYEKI